MIFLRSNSGAICTLIAETSVPLGQKSVFKNFPSNNQEAEAGGELEGPELRITELDSSL